jgi:adenine deaminase
LVKADDFFIEGNGDKIRVIKAVDGELITKEWLIEPKIEKGMIVTDIKRDILLLVVVNRYQPVKPSIGFIHGFSLKAGALASTVAHDSHNIIAVAADISSLCIAVNLLIKQQGGIVVVDADQKTHILPLPIAGLMSHDDADKIANLYADLDQRAKKLGSTLRAPFMTLSFMALLVIPELKLSDKGLFDGRSFSFTSLVV